jgi:hypothetical protein
MKERQRRGTTVPAKQPNLCRPYGARQQLFTVPRADALGYPLVAPPALRSSARAVWVASNPDCRLPQFSLVECTRSIHTFDYER